MHVIGWFAFSLNRLSPLLNNNFPVKKLCPAIDFHWLYQLDQGFQLSIRRQPGQLQLFLP
jgi:hypothetical protein